MQLFRRGLDMSVPSVRPSVCQMGDLWQNERNFCRHSDTIWKVDACDYIRQQSYIFFLVRLSVCFAVCFVCLFGNYTIEQDCLSSDGRPPAIRIHKQAFLLMWPWPWLDYRDKRIWPRYSDDVPAYKKWTSQVNAFKIYSSDSTNRYAFSLLWPWLWHDDLII